MTTPEAVSGDQFRQLPGLKVSGSGRYSLDSGAAGLRGGSAVESAQISQIRNPPSRQTPTLHPGTPIGESTVGEQLQMFMTPREIHTKYQGLDADRAEFPLRSLGGSRFYQPAQETHEAMWSRKLADTHQWGPSGQHGEFDPNDPDYEDPLASIHEGDPGHGESLYQNVARRGVQGPVRLGTEIGELGKPEIIGGHHRLAVQTDVDPDQPIPVLHDKNVLAARYGRHNTFPYA